MTMPPNNLNLIKVLFIIDGLHSGGKERQMVEIMRALKDDKNFRSCY